MKKYKIKKNKQLIRKLKPYWKKLQELVDIHRGLVFTLEKKMEKETGIKGIEFFWSDLGEYVGIGNADRTMPLIHDRELLEE